MEDDLLKRVAEITGSPFKAPKLPTNKFDTERDALERGARALGVDPVDYATAISYETGGTFDPWQAGPTTKWGQHRGTIQYGEPQRKKYKVYQGQPFEEQVEQSNVQYLKDAGVKPGATFAEIYAAINGGNTKKNLSTRDADTGRTIADNIRNAQRDHRSKVMQRYGWEDIDDDSLMADVGRILGGGTNVSDDIVGQVDKRLGTQVSPTNPNQAANIPITPVPETPETIEAQIISTVNAGSPKAATLLTEPGQEKLFDPALLKTLKPVQTPQGLLLVNEAKAKALGITDYAGNLASLIGKVADVGTETTSGPTVLTVDPATGKELSSSIAPSPEDGQKQVQVDQKAYPGSVSTLVDAQDVVAKREADLLREQQIAVMGHPIDTLDGTSPAEQITEKTLAPAYADFLQQTGLQDNPDSQKEFQTVQQTLAKPPLETTQMPAQNVRKTTRTAGTPAVQQGGGVSHPRQIGTATDGLNRVAVEYTPKKGETPRQAAVNAVIAAGMTPQEAETWAKNRERDGIALLKGTPGQPIHVPYHVLEEIRGTDATIAGIRSEQAQGRTDPNVGIDLDVDTNWTEVDTQSLKDTIGPKATEAFGGLLGSGGRTARALAGVLRPINTDAYEAMQEVAGVAEKFESNAEQKDGYGVFKLIGGLPGDLSRLMFLTRLPYSGPVVGFALESGLQSSGRGDNLTEIAKQTGKGALLGSVFKFAPAIGKFGEFATAKTITSALGQKIIREGVTLGTIGLGSAQIEKSFGSTDEQAFHAAIVNSLFHLGGKAINSLSGKTIRARTADGKEATVAVTPEGEVKLLKGEKVKVEDPDIEMFFNEKTGMYEKPGETAPVRAKETGAPNDRGNKIETSQEPRQLEEYNPQRIESPDPAAVQKVSLDTRARKIVDALRNKTDFTTIEDVAKAAKVNKVLAEDAVMTLYGAGMVELLPGNRVRLVKEATQPADLFERAKTYGQIPQPPTVQPQQPSVAQKPLVQNQQPSSTVPAQATGKTVSESEPVKPAVQTNEAVAPDIQAQTEKTYESLPQQKAQPAAPETVEQRDTRVAEIETSRKAELHKSYKQAFSLPLISAKSSRLRQKIDVSFTRPDGKAITKSMTVADRQKQLEAQGNALQRLVDCIHG